MEQISIDSPPPVARTLLRPMACRAFETVRPDAILRDKKALKLMDLFIGLDDLVRNVSKHDRFFLVKRTQQIDSWAGAFLQEHPRGLVVDFGCGLDTRFTRIDNGGMTWLGLDLPEVIDLRKRFLPDGQRQHSLPGSLTDPPGQNECGPSTCQFSSLRKVF